VLALVLACSRPYQVGDHVLVEWGDEGHLYPAFIVEQKGKSLYRVHFEGYAARWDEDVSLPRIKARVEGEAPQPPPPRKVLLAQGGGQKSRSEGGLVAHYEVGDRVKVTWRRSVYRATVLEVVGPSAFRVHYDGHEQAWDEVVPLSRIVTGP
jgi:hypothetical protein